MQVTIATVGMQDATVEPKVMLRSGAARYENQTWKNKRRRPSASHDNLIDLIQNDCDCVGLETQ